MKAREEEDSINDFGRDPIGEGKDEQASGTTPTECMIIMLFQAHNKDLKLALNNKMDDAEYTSEIGERRHTGSSEVLTDMKRKRPKLEELTRFTMVKRIW